MKKQIALLLALPLLLAGCGGSSDSSKERLIQQDIYSSNREGNVITTASFKFLYKANSEVPYLNLKDGASVIADIRKSHIGETASCEASIKDNQLTYKVENGNSAVFDIDKQTITFADFDAFYNVASTKPMTPITPSADSKAFKLIKQEYQAGKEVTFDLKPYSHLDIYRSGDAFYVPYTVFSDVFLSSQNSSNFAYNFKDFYFLNNVAVLTKNILGETAVTDLGRKYYEEAKQSATISREYAAFTYDSLCFNLDHTYGLKADKSIASFDSYFTSKGYREDLLSGDAHTMDNALAYALSTLLDGHTGKDGTSPLYPYGENTADIKKFDPARIAWDAGQEKLTSDKEKAEIKIGLNMEPVSGAAFINFNEFTETDEELLYTDLDLEPIISTALIFKNAYQTITSNEYKDKTKYVVVDLSTNIGGAIDAVIYSLSTLLGEIFIDSINPISGAHNRSYYKVDINNDGKIDANDKSLKELGYKIAFIDSGYTFSSGNALPVFAKENDSSILTIGEKTGGGPCALRQTVSPIGATFSQSGLTVLAKKDGSGWKNIEGGVAADQAIEKESMLNYLYIGAMLPDWFTK